MVTRGYFGTNFYDSGILAFWKNISNCQCFLHRIGRYSESLHYRGRPFSTTVVIFILYLLSFEIFLFLLLPLPIMFSIIERYLSWKRFASELLTILSKWQFLYLSIFLFLNKIYQIYYIAAFINICVGVFIYFELS